MGNLWALSNFRISHMLLTRDIRSDVFVLRLDNRLPSHYARMRHGPRVTQPPVSGDNRSNTRRRDAGSLTLDNLILKTSEIVEPTAAHQWRVQFVGKEAMDLAPGLAIHGPGFLGSFEKIQFGPWHTNGEDLSTTGTAHYKRMPGVVCYLSRGCQGYLLWKVGDETNTGASPVVDRVSDMQDIG
ncbi:hypothetical protein N657DRAFT_641617 [Parathielavia appendiculata]|uniref:Uncharacterized protein n=1 Tax=Parathielavia appendiculata TaxID=2587402 RepID=A0AAN6U7D0_9PEZI|nr:hypothetical protein N657DRAFT_641617 [Parathielavia appendiculata]